MRGFLGIATLLGATALPAQTTDNWYSTVEFNPVFSTQSGGEPSFNINYTFNRKVADYVSLGAGVGIEESWKFKGTPMLPVFARVQAEDFSKTFSPFARFDIGYEAGFGDVKGGLMINPTVGVRYGALSLGVGYRGFKSSISGSKKSSASKKDRYSPFASESPLFLAAPAPAFLWLIRRTLLSCRTYSSSISGDLSEEPSSTQIISVSFNVCPTMLSMHRTIYFSPL